MAEWLFFSFFIGASLALIYASFKSLKKARIIEDVPTSKIRSAHQGYVELIGIARQQEGQLVSATLTNSACLWYDYKIERYQGGKNSHWTTVEESSSEEFFELSDGTGECLIDPRRSDVLTSVKKRWSGYQRHPAHMQETSLLGRLRRQRYRYTERRIHADQPVYAIGWFQTIHASSADQQQKDYVARLITTWKQDYEKMLERFDSNRDGHIDQREWQRARQQATREAQQHVTANYDNTDIHIMSKPASGQAYILSTSDPAELTSHYRRQSMGMLLAGLFSSGISIWFALNRL
jgi:hypothetical protein